MLSRRYYADSGSQSNPGGLAIRRHLAQRCL